MRTRPLALLLLLLVSLPATAASAAPIKAAYFYGYMNRDHLDSLKNAGFNRAVIKSLGDSLTPARQGEMRSWLQRGNALGMEVAAAWSIQSPSRVLSRPPSRRYTWGAGNVESGVGCPVDSLFWKTVLHDRALDFLRGVPGLKRLHLDLEHYVGSRTHYNAGPCRCGPCMSEYATYTQGRPPALVPSLEAYQETRITGILSAWLMRLQDVEPNLEIAFFDLDLDVFVHHAMCRALAATRMKTANFTERTYRLGASRLLPARQALERNGLAAPLVGGIHLQLFSPAALPIAVRDILAQAEGCFVFTTYSLWQKPEQLTGPYTLPATQAEYWTALGEGFSQPDLAGVDLRLTPDPLRSDLPSEVRFTIANRGRQSASDTRWVLRSDGVVVAQGDAPVAARQSVALSLTLPPSFSVGTHRLQLEVDALGQVFESDEANNVLEQTITVSAPPPPVTPPPVVPPVTPPPTNSMFPATGVVDDFDRPSGPLGGAWVGTIDGVVISSQRWKPGGSYYRATIWDGFAMGENQEAYVTFAAVTSSGIRQGLLLKVQGRSVESGAIEVRYDGSRKQVFVATFTPGEGWRDQGTGIPVKISSGDILGARAYRSGEVAVFRNGVRIGTRSVAGWPFAARGGRVGLTAEKSSSTRFDDFGGGSLDPTLAMSSNRLPVARATVNARSGQAPLTVAFSSAESRDPDGDVLAYEWSFGDGGFSTEAAPIHVFPPGTWRTVLTVHDAQGGATTDTVEIQVSAGRTFPSAFVVDNFDRSSGPVGRPWTSADVAVISSKKLKPGTSALIAPVWDGAVFGEDQEAFVRLKTIASSGPRQGLLLKVQGTSVDAGAIEIRYDAARRLIIVATFTPGAGWQERGAGIARKLSSSSILGARAYRTGEVEVFVDGVLIGTRSVAGWPFATRSGRIGLIVENASSARFDDFGGGSLLGLAAANTVVDPSSARLGTRPMPDLPAELELRGPAPNPFTHQTAIHFALPVDGHVDLSIYDVTGRRMATLVDGPMRAGTHASRWNGVNLYGAPVSAGVYFARLQFGKIAQVKRVVVTR